MKKFTADYTDTHKELILRNIPMWVEKAARYDKNISRTDTVRSVIAAAELADDRVKELEEILHAIGDLAHDKSSGPTVPDVYWEIREMAYGPLRK
jgi:hypothetical protein